MQEQSAEFEGKVSGVKLVSSPGKGGLSPDEERETKPTRRLHLKSVLRNGEREIYISQCQSFILFLTHDDTLALTQTCLVVQTKSTFLLLSN